MCSAVEAIRPVLYLLLVIYLILLNFPAGGPLCLLTFALISYFGPDLLRLGRRGLALVAPGR
jgi:hypothetical protein